MASITDKITETQNGQNPRSATVTGPRSIGGLTLGCDSLTGWPTNTAIHFATYQKDSSNNKIAGTQVDWKGVVSGANINTLTRQGGASDTGNGVGDIVEMMPTNAWGQDLASGLEQTLNSDGTLRTGIVTSSKIADGTVTGTDIASETITSANILNGTIAFADLLSTIYSGQVQTQANAGSAGGNMWWINLGGIKLLWGLSASCNTSASPASFNFTLPTFFSSLQATLAAIVQQSGDANQTIAGSSATTTTIATYVTSPSGSASLLYSILLIGT